MDPAIQEEFNIRKGSIPARLDVKPDNFGPCGQKGIADRAAAVKNGDDGALAVAELGADHRRARRLRGRRSTSSPTRRT